MRTSILRATKAAASVLAAVAVIPVAPFAAHAMENNPVGCHATGDDCDWGPGGGEQVPMPPDPWVPDDQGGDSTPPWDSPDPHKPGPQITGYPWKLINYNTKARKGTYRAAGEPTQDPSRLAGVSNCTADPTDPLQMTCDVPHAQVRKFDAGFAGAPSTAAAGQKLTYVVTTQAASDGDSVITLRLRGVKIDPDEVPTGPAAWVDLSSPDDPLQVFIAPWLHKGDVSQLIVHLVEDDTDKPASVSVAANQDGTRSTATLPVQR